MGEHTCLVLRCYLGQKFLVQLQSEVGVLRTRALTRGPCALTDPEGDQGEADPPGGDADQPRSGRNRDGVHCPGRHPRGAPWCPGCRPLLPAEEEDRPASRNSGAF